WRTASAGRRTRSGPTPRTWSPARARAGWGELAFGVLLLAVAVTVLVDAAGLRASTSASGVGPAFFPTIVGVTLFAVAAALVVEVLRGHRGTPDEGEGDVDPSRTQLRPALLVVGAVLAHGLLLDLAGYVVAAFVAFWGIAYALGARHPVRTPAISLGVAVVVFLGFTYGLGIDLPAGPLEGIG
ncbi:tripartite tricarboxylate transporter TctB family protein, partial [Micromonospora sp. NPDC050200]|uniref:tripartite tricarboxylate transporter TctB family protein n=1 Tax=Micromonospora sp. NPDC050200 TaxID=3155664 RepID=UPI0033D7B11B